MFEINFDTSNASFKNEVERQETIRIETMRILIKITQQIENGKNSSKILDSNGNVIGFWRFK